MEEGDEPDQYRLVACTPKHRTQMRENTKLRYLKVREDFRRKAWRVSLESESSPIPARTD